MGAKEMRYLNNKKWAWDFANNKNMLVNMETKEKVSPADCKLISGREAVLLSAAMQISGDVCHECQYGKKCYPPSIYFCGLSSEIIMTEALAVWKNN